MPLDELAEFGLRLGIEAIASAVDVAGSGRSRAAAWVRAGTWIVAACIFAALLWLMLRHGLGYDGVGRLAIVALLAVVGALAAWQLAAEVRLLRHWGEPNVSMTDRSLVIPGHAPIAWTEIVSITAEHRRKRGLVRIICDGKRSVVIPSSKPDALAKLLLAEKDRRP
jgi:hypothetical protein